MSETGRKITIKEFNEWCRQIEQATIVFADEAPVTKRDRIARAKKDFNFFLTYYFPHYCTEAKTNRIINCADFHIEAANKIKSDPNIFAVLEWPREHAKSVMVDIIIPMWLKIQGELDGMILTGKSYDDACAQLSDLQAEFATNNRYIHDFGEQKLMGSWQDGYFETADGILFVALGRGQSPRGLRNRQRRPNYCSIDDIDDDELVLNPKRVHKTVRWILGALYGALAINGGRLIMVGNRIHKESVLAMIADRRFDEGDEDDDEVHEENFLQLPEDDEFDEEDADDPQYIPGEDKVYHSVIKALLDNGKPAWPQKFTLKALRRKFRRMGNAIAQTEFFHNPQVEGKIFKHKFIQWKTMLPIDEYEAAVVYIDPSFKSSATSDYKAAKFWGKQGRELHCIKAFVRKCSFTTLVKWCYDLHEDMQEQFPKAQVDFYIEGVFAQDDLIDDFEDEGDVRGYQLPLMPDMREKPDKFARILTMQPYYERGYVYYNASEKQNVDMNRGIDQLIGIESGTNTADDSPDADEGAWYKLNRMTRARKRGVLIGAREHRSNF